MNPRPDLDLLNRGMNAYYLNNVELPMGNYRPDHLLLANGEEGQLPFTGTKVCCEYRCHEKKAGPF